ncbi:MAG: acyl-CoA dehydrogenase family protein, partial [Gemmatimonadota bacterium]
MTDREAATVVTDFRALSDLQQEIVRTARDFANNELAPHVAEWDRTGHFPRDKVDKLGELGFLGMLVPEEWGGSGLDTVTYLMALEEIARVDPSMAVTM